MVYYSCNSLGDFLREAREYAGYSQAGLSRAIGLSTSYINLIENDRRVPSTTVVRKLVSFLDADFDKAYGLWRKAKNN